jgi:nucleotide-binding universal stress UspA family protein
MFQRLLLAIDDSPSGQTAVSFASGLAAQSGAAVRVLHVNRYQAGGRGLTVETGEEAAQITADAVMDLLLAGVDASGLACVTTCFGVADRIAAEALGWRADAIVVGSRRCRGLRRFTGRGVREALTRLSALPVLVAPGPLHVSRLRPARTPRTAGARHGPSAIAP